MGQGRLAGAGQTCEPDGSGPVTIELFAPLSTDRRMMPDNICGGRCHYFFARVRMIA
jgi:hypothetical protein